MIDSFSGKYAFLSNFYTAGIIVAGLEFTTTEHAFQAWKMTNRADAESVRLCPTPGQAKRLARKLPRRDDWDDIKIGVMLDVCSLKFKSGVLRERLLDTSGHNLVEGNTWGDRFWGVCDGVGENWLGKVLMKIRSDLEHAR